jgi:small subunit ribosomal protein S1
LSDQADAGTIADDTTESTAPAGTTATLTAESGMGSFDDQGRYVPRQVTEDDLGGLSLDDAYTQSMVEVEDGQIVDGRVVKVDRDEVLLDIGYKSEGVIPSR